MSHPPRREHVGRTIRAEIAIRATPEQVWDAWAEPDHIARWFVDRAEGSMAKDAVVTWMFDAFQYRIPVQVFEAKRPSFLAFGGDAMQGRPPALQEIAIHRDGAHTILRLANSGFRDDADFDDEYEGVVSGWDMALATLKHWLERFADRERAQRLSIRPGSFDFAKALELFTTKRGLESWLAVTARLGADPLVQGSRVELDLADGGGRLTGSVLARTSRELLLSWEERDGVLGLKAFVMGPTRAAGLHASAWGAAPAAAEEMAGVVEAASDRLAARLA